MRTLEQEFAGTIYSQVANYVSAHPNEDDPDRKKYGAMANKLPILVCTAGLVQALAFVESRGEAPHKDLLAHLAQVAGNASKDDFLAQSRQADLQGYIYLTRRTMLALKWYKRFAQSILKVEPGGE